MSKKFDPETDKDFKKNIPDVIIFKLKGRVTDNSSSTGRYYRAFTHSGTPLLVTDDTKTMRTHLVSGGKFHDGYLWYEYEKIEIPHIGLDSPQADGEIEDMRNNDY